MNKAMNAPYVQQMINLYWEADRTTVKEAYERLFKSPPDRPPCDEPQVSEWSNQVLRALDDHSAADQEKALREVIDSQLFVVPPQIGASIIGHWESLSVVLKDLVSLYISDYFQWYQGNPNWTRSFCEERILNSIGVGPASHFFHWADPSSAFPIYCGIEMGYRSDFRYDYFTDTLTTLGINTNLGGRELEIEALWSITDGIEEYRAERELEHWQMWALIYDLGPKLRAGTAEYPPSSKRCWVVGTNDTWGEFEVIDSHAPEDVGTWAINPNAKRGDLALMYCVSPRSAITSVYRCTSDAYFDPFASWNDHRGAISERIPIPWLRISEMRDDPILRDWKLVRSNFQGLLKHEVPEVVWQRIVEIVTERDSSIGSQLKQYADAARGVRSIKVSDEVWSESEFEDQLLIPLMVELGWHLNETLLRQVEMDIKVGSGRPRRVRADFVGYPNAASPESILIIETKRRISSSTALKFAVEQAESYAGKLRCSRFAVASPEGLWVYELSFPGQSNQLASVEVDRSVRELDVAILRPLLGFEALSQSGRRPG